MELEDIPSEVRWEIATKASMASSIGYGMAFRQILGEDTVRKVEESITAQGGKELKNIADSLGMPAENAIEVDDAYGFIGMAIVGKMEYETLESSETRVVQRITSCPNLNTHKDMKAPIISMPHLCQVYSSSAVEELNPKYTHSFTKKMCAGDDCCEYAVELKK
jgi:hypothetical protein